MDHLDQQEVDQKIPKQEDIQVMINKFQNNQELEHPDHQEQEVHQEVKKDIQVLINKYHHNQEL